MKDLLKQAWEAFITDGVPPPPDRIRPVIRDSWIRCRNLHIDPYQVCVQKTLDRDAFEACLRDNEQLIRYSTPYITNLFEFVKDSGFIIGLSSADGILLKLIGRPSDLESVRRGNFLEGADWSEESAGTNAVGTALYNKAPIQVFSYEHFCRCSQRTTCSCAPIRDPNFNIVGSICLVGADDLVNSHTLGMVVAVANAVENCFTMIRAERACRTANRYKEVLIESISQGVLAVDLKGNVTHINSVAASILGLQGGMSFVGRNIRNILPSGNERFLSLIENVSRVTDQELALNTSKGVARYNITSRPFAVDQDAVEGIVLVIEEIRKVKKVIQRLSNAVASMTFDNIVGVDANYLQTIDLARHVAGSDAVVLLLGESGTGKDIIAQCIHNASRRHKGPFVAINCAAIPKELIGSELFGYSEGAFTGARRGGNIGKFELADGGTLFLDEIGDMPLDMQTNLLRVIESKSIVRIGGNDLIPVDVRIIAATNKDLETAVAEGRFRNDLYYRLNVIEIQMLPLREHPSDIPVLAEHFYRRFAGQLEKRVFPIPEEYIDQLYHHSFPGNVRELQNIIERSVNLSEDGRLSPDTLPNFRLQQGGAEPVLKARQGRAAETPLANDLETVERQTILRLLRERGGQISVVAKELGISRSTLYRKMKAYNLQREVFIEEGGPAHGEGTR